MIDSHAGVYHHFHANRNIQLLHRISKTITEPYLSICLQSNNCVMYMKSEEILKYFSKFYLLFSHLPPITKTIQVRQTRHAGHCWRSRDELISDVLLWTPTHGRAKAGRPARTYIQQLCEDTGCCPEDLPEAMNDREKWRERVRDIRATSTT